ncbi:MAG: Cysteine desulfurase activator SufB [Candidatus Methanohalarchaeum thermophilum]|uniref:Cysteine desulfurase activator SufB n=1 Tax=Methanohalarchaeum thermophilum TaxID=1903181 RepID=A0A1Q6DTV3_METT1|nr:MAG: Cysteine desulfurase activator SufB [Candidatus Methanohalarchaeum thermophilum]
MLPDGKKLEYQNKAEEYINKPASLGEDIDIDDYPIPEEDQVGVSSISEVDEGVRESMKDVGMELEEGKSSGTYYQLDNNVLMSEMYGDIEVMPINQAMEKYDLDDYYWNAVNIKDKYTARTELELTKGYFIRVPSGVKESIPVQTCMLLGDERKSQNVHNIIIVEDNAELHVVTGCATTKEIKSALHVGVSEFYIGKDSKLTFNMIHNWGENVHVRPRTGAIIDDGGSLVNNYVLVSPVKSIQSYPTAYCRGKNSKASFQTVLYGKKQSKMDIGSRTILSGKNSSSDMISRSITEDESHLKVRGELIGETEDVRGHLECKGLIFSDDSILHAIPELKAKKSGLDLSHEAAVGKIAEEQIRYLMARGLTEEEATSLIIKGFLSLDIEGLPPNIAETVDNMMEMTLEKAL